MNNYIAFDVGGTKVKHSVLTESGIFLEKGEYHTNRQEADGFMADMFRIIDLYRKKYEITGVTISMPGFIHVETGLAETAGAITVLNGMNLKTMIEEQTSLQTEIENDGNCVALAEKFNGNATACSSFVCITIGTGIGGGIYLNDAIHHGSSCRGGEIGFMITLGEQHGQETWNENGATSILINSYKAYKGMDSLEKVEGHVVFEEAEKNEEVDQLVEQWLERVSYGILNVAAALNPEKILIGGGISGREGLIERIEEKLENIKWWEFIRVPIDSCLHRNDAGMLGALHHFLTRR